MSLLCSSVFASQEYRSRVWQTEDGLPHNSVTAVLQTADGFLWIGTREGLARFDGVRFTDVRLASGIKGAGDSISALYQSKDGSIWAGFENGGLLRWNGGRSMRLDEREGLLSGGVRRIVEDREGSIWIGTANGINLFKDEKLARFEPTDFFTNAVRAIDTTGKDGLVVGTGSGLGIFKEGETFIFQKRNGLPHSSIRDVVVDRKGYTWIATEAGLSRYHEGEFVHFTQADGLAGSFVTALHEDRAGNLWIGTYDGLNRMTAGRIAAELTDEGTPFEPVNVISEDAEGNIWVGTRGGLYRLTRSRFGALTRAQGLNHHTAVSVLEDSSGNVWMGMLSGGLNCLSNSQIISYTASNGLSSDLTLGLHEGKDGSIWVGTDHLGGFNQWKDGTFKQFGREYGFKSGITALYQGQKGNLWIGTRSGLFRQDPESGEISRQTRGGMGSIGINAILQNHRGALWFGTDQGLCRRTKDGFEFFKGERGLGEGPVLAIYEDPEQKIWIGTRDKGISRWDEKKFVIYNSDHGLFHNTIYEILEGDYGYFWMSCPKGIFRVRRKDFDDLDSGKIKRLSCTAYGKVDGVISTECIGIAKPAGCKTSDGRLWFPTSKGMLIVDPSIQMNSLPPPVFIEGILADKRDVTPSRRNQIGPREPERAPDAVTIPPGGVELEFRYTALSFQIPEKVRFKYKLEGVDRDWVDAGTQRTATYNNVAPGKYRFHVIACNNDDFWNEHGDSIQLNLRPHFWQTWWFSGLAGVLCIAFVGGGARYISIRKLRRKLKLLEQEHAVQKERARIAQDMHDDFGSRLTEASLACDQARQTQSAPGQLEARLERVSSVIREMADNMDTLVWSVNPGNDSLDKLVSYIQEYSHNLLDLTSIRCRFEIAAPVPGYPISSEVRHNLFLALKEALNNAVKYSGASQIWVSIQWTDSHVSISVADNGAGFARETVSETGNGLPNMEKRLKDIGGHCAISSAPGEGTQIRFQLPISSDGESE